MLRALLLLLFSIAAGAYAGEVRIAHAASMTYCISELNALYGTRHPDARLHPEMGATGQLADAIERGRVVDIFLSADAEMAHHLVQLKLAEETGVFEYGLGQLAVWTTDPALEPSPMDALLHDPRVTSIAIGNPVIGPYGKAALEMLRKSGAWNEVRPKLTTGEHIITVTNLVRYGAAQVGIVPLAIMRAPMLAGIGRYAVVPRDLHSPIRHVAILTIQGTGNREAVEYFAFLKGPEARKVFDKYGLVPPPDLVRKH